MYPAQQKVDERLNEVTNPKTPEERAKAVLKQKEIDTALRELEGVVDRPKGNFKKIVGAYAEQLLERVATSQSNKSELRVRALQLYGRLGPEFVVPQRFQLSYLSDLQNNGNDPAVARAAAEVLRTNNKPIRMPKQPLIDGKRAIEFFLPPPVNPRR